MASIALYDLDFWHGRKFIPNLELMKIYNYYYKNGDMVAFVGPNSIDLERFSKIYYIFANKNTMPPKNWIPKANKAIIYGEGWSGRFVPLSKEMRGMPPNFMCYDLESDKIKNLKAYEKIKNNSIVRVENMDLSGFKENKKNIFIYDSNFLYSKNNKEFLKDYSKKYHLYYLRPLIARDPDTAEKFYYDTLDGGRRIALDFKPDKDFLIRNSNKSFIYLIQTFSREELIRAVKSILITKNQNNAILFEKTNVKEKTYKSLVMSIIRWGICKDYTMSFYDYAEKEYPAVLKSSVSVLNSDSELRLLLKQKPQTLNINTLTL